METVTQGLCCTCILFKMLIVLDPPPSPQQNVFMWPWPAMQLIYLMCSVLLVSRDVFTTSHNFLTTNTLKIFDYLTGL